MWKLKSFDISLKLMTIECATIKSNMAAARMQKDSAVVLQMRAIFLMAACTSDGEI